MSEASTETARTPRWVRALDGALDGTVVAFGVWTLLYVTAMYAGVRASTTLLVWLPLAVLAVVGCAWLETRRTRQAPEAAEPEDLSSGPLPGRQRLPGWVFAALVVGLGVATMLYPALYLTRRWPLLPMLLLMACGVVLVLGHAALQWRRFGQARTPRGLEHAVVLVGAAGLAGVIPFFRRPQGDDVYVVNRGVWTAEHDTFALRDTMFGPETYASTYGGGPPLTSVEGLFGALARAVGVSGAEFAYLVAPSVICVLAVWASWRLVREWASRRHLLVLAVSVVFLLWASHGALGDMSYLRLWTGKVIGFMVIMPLTWTYLTRIARPAGRSLRWQLAMLFALGLAFAGLTGTATLLAPFVSAGVGLAALANLQSFWRLVAGATAFSVPPVLYGLATILLSSSGVGRREEWRSDPWVAFIRALGPDNAIIALVLLALVVAPLLARSRAAASLGAGAAAVFVVAILPGVPRLLDSLLGTGVIHFRILMVPPIAVMVGLLVTIPLPRAVPRVAERVAGVGFAAVLVTAVVLGGTAPWNAPNADVTPTPQLKVGKGTYDDVKAVIELDPDGPVLLPQRHMRTLTTVSTEVFAVTPRGFDLLGLPEAGNPRHRRVLNRYARLNEKAPSPKRFRKALEVVDVAMVCLPHEKPKPVRIRMLQQAGYTATERAGDLTCYSRAAELR